MTDPAECAYCGEREGLRQIHEGWGNVPPDYTCEECFSAPDDGPCFDDLPEVKDND